jgi:hypothetical protein
MARKQPDPQPDPDAVYVAVQGFASGLIPGNENAVFSRGTRLRGSHPAVRLHFENWVLDGLSDDEIHARQAALGAPLRV